MKRYILVGSNYKGRSIRGEAIHMGLRVIATADTYEETVALTDEYYDACGGLILWIDSMSGKAGEPEGPRSLAF